MQFSCRGSASQSGGSLATLTETTNLNGDTWTRVFNAATRTWLTTSPAGRTSTTVVDAAGRTTQVTVPGITPRTASFDSFGRLSTTAQCVRNQVFNYFSAGDAASGYLQSVTDPLSQTTTYTRDALGRELSETAPDSAITGFGWDPLDNLSSVTPPGQPAHAMSYTPVNLLSTYTPPALASLVNPQTVYEYDPDRNLSTVTRPDGVVLHYGYDSAGRLQTITAPTSTITRSYTNRQLSEISSSADGTTIDFTYDGQTLKPGNFDECGICASACSWARTSGKTATPSRLNRRI
jgi:YD repeat-containing protein